MWLGNLKKLVVVFLVLLSGLIGAQFVSGTPQLYKVLITLLIAIIFCLVYKKKKMFELV